MPGCDAPEETCRAGLPRRRRPASTAHDDGLVARNSALPISVGNWLDAGLSCVHTGGYALSSIRDRKTARDLSGHHY